MKKVLLSLLAMGVVTTGYAQLRTEPPKVIRIYREEMKPGRGAQHEKIEAGYVHAFKKANWPIHYFAMSALSLAATVFFSSASSFSRAGI